MIFTWSKEWASPIGRAIKEPANQIQTITILSINVSKAFCLDKTVLNVVVI
jgi:hypothetical protein